MAPIISPELQSRLQKALTVAITGATEGEQQAGHAALKRLLEANGIHGSEVKLASGARPENLIAAMKEAEAKQDAAYHRASEAERKVRDAESRLAKAREKLRAEKREASKPPACNEYATATQIDAAGLSDQKLSELGRKHIEAFAASTSRNCADHELPFAVLVQEAIQRRRDTTDAEWRSQGLPKRPSQAAWLAMLFGVRERGDGVSVRWCYLCVEALEIVRSDDWPEIYQRFATGQAVSARSIVAWRKAWCAEQEGGKPMKPLTASQRLKAIGATIEAAKSLEEVQARWRELNPQTKR